MGSRGGRRRRFRGVAGGVLTLVAVAGWLVVAAGASASSPAGLSWGLHEVAVDDPHFQDVRDFLKSVGMTDAMIAQVAQATDKDKLADWFDFNLAPAKIQPKGTDIVTGTFFELKGADAAKLRTAAKAAPGGAFTEADPVEPAGQPTTGEWYGYATTTDGPLAGAAGLRVEAGLGAFTETPPGGGVAVRFDTQQAGNFFRGFNVAWSTRSDQGGPFQLFEFQYLKAGGIFGQDKTDAVSFLRGSTLITLLPEAEASGFVDARAFAYTESGGNQAADTYPDMGDPPKDAKAVPVLNAGLAPEPTPAATHQTEASPSAEASPALPDVVPGQTDNTGQMPWIAIALLGLGFVFVGAWLLWGRRPQPALVSPGPPADDLTLPLVPTGTFDTIGTAQDTGPVLPPLPPPPAAPQAVKPELPPETPPVIRAFVECTSDTATFNSGELDWLALPPELKKLKPKLTIEPGETPGGVNLKIGLAFFSVTIPTSIKDGELEADTSGVPSGLPGLGDLDAGVKALQAWLKALNAWLKANGKQIGPPIYRDGSVTLTKEALVPGQVSEPQAAGTDWSHLTPTVEQWDAALKEAKTAGPNPPPKPPGNKWPGK